jgi:hypothetical protein
MGTYPGRGKSKRAGLQVPGSNEGKIWRLPTLAEAIQPLPSATLRLTSEFGMGSGRTTALWPPKKCVFSEIYI